jgi:hypothetical protein
MTVKKCEREYERQMTTDSRFTVYKDDIVFLLEPMLQLQEKVRTVARLLLISSTLFHLLDSIGRQQ